MTTPLKPFIFNIFYKEQHSSPIFRIALKRTEAIASVLFCIISATSDCLCSFQTNAEESLEPMGSRSPRPGGLRRSVRWEKGPPDLFLFPPHLACRLGRRCCYAAWSAGPARPIFRHCSII